MSKPSSPREFLAISTSSNTNKIIPVCFEEDWNVGIGGGLWSTGLALAYYFIDHRLDFVRQLSNIVRRRKASSMKMIELGSGNGFLSIVLSACLLACRYECLIDFHTDLVATDLEDHLNMIRRTMQSNDHIVELDTEKEAEKYDQQTFSEKIKISVKEHAWGVFSNCEAMIASDEKFDFIFGSDLAYRDYLHSTLISSLARLSHKDTISLIGVTMSDTKPAFFDSLTKAGFRYQRLEDGLMRPEFRGNTFGIFVIQKM